MTIHIAYLLAALSTTAFIVLWFWVARKELRMKQSTLYSAESQLVTYREKYAHAGDDVGARGVLKTSLGIYRQTLELYNKTLSKPWFLVPGLLMGYRHITERGQETLE